MEGNQSHFVPGTHTHTKKKYTFVRFPPFVFTEILDSGLEYLQWPNCLV